MSGTRRGRIPPWERWRSLKLRDFDEARLATLGDARIINLRATYGPRELQRRYVLPTAARLHAHARIAAAVRETLGRFGSRPAVGVHLRQGDFQVSGDVYEATAHRHSAPGLWWYEHVMSAYARAFPDVYFVLGYSGDSEALARLREKFELVCLPRVFRYVPFLPGHRSAGHPVVDLFGLACCTTLVATPTSSFSHWAANLLGPRTKTILPPPRTTRAEPRFGIADLHGCVVLDWRDAAERGISVAPVPAGAAPPPPSPPVTEWL